MNAEPLERIADALERIAFELQLARFQRTDECDKYPHERHYPSPEGDPHER